MPVALPAGLGVKAKEGLSASVDHHEMAMLLPRGPTHVVGVKLPLASALFGVLGASATGSKANPNAPLATMQENVSLLLDIKPSLLAASPTTGIAFGSMIAATKIVVGCNATRMKRCYA